MRHVVHRAFVAGSVAVAVAGFGLVGCSGNSGEALVNSKCDRCHSLDRIAESTNKTQADWDQTVAIMKAHGLRITDEEQAAIVEYLVEQSGK